MVQVTDSNLGPYQGKALDRVLQYAAVCCNPILNLGSFVFSRLFGFKSCF